MEIVKQHIKKIYYWVIVLVVLVALVLIYAFYTKPTLNGQLTEEQKQAILNDLAQSGAPTLTDQEKTDILNDLSNSTPTNVTDEDKINILNSLQ